MGVRECNSEGGCEGSGKILRTADVRARVVLLSRSGCRVQERIEGLADHGAWCHAVSDGAVVELGVAASLSHVCRPCSTMDGVSRHTPSAWAMGASMSKICGWLGGLRGMPVKSSSAPSPGLHMCPCRGGKGAEEGRVQPRAGTSRSARPLREHRYARKASGLSTSLARLIRATSVHTRQAVVASARESSRSLHQRPPADGGCRCGHLTIGIPTTL